MDLYSKKCLEGLVKRIQINDEFPGYFDQYDRVYPFTNESISEYLKYADFNKKDFGLSVLSSGDHAFCLIEKGLTNIDTFDVNRLTEYYALGLKRAMIMKYNYMDFLTISNIFNYQMGFSKKAKVPDGFNIKDDIIRQIVLDLSYSMDKKYRDFFLKLIDTSLGDKYIVEYLLNGASRRLVANIDYLSSEEAYNRLRCSLGNANITYTYSDIANIPSKFKGNKYDIVLFSNILDYVSCSFGRNWDIEKFRDFSTSIEEMCNNDAVIFMHYLLPWRYLSVEKKFGTVFSFSSIYKRDLDDYSIYPLISSIPEQGIMLKKVKK